MYVDARGSGRLDVLVKLAGVKRISPHGLRDTVATTLAANGTPIKTIAQRLGHAKASMTIDRYVASLEQDQKRAGQLLDEAFG